MRKPDFCLCENKDADHLHSNCEADQSWDQSLLLYGYSTIPVLLKSETSSFLLSSVTVQPGLCQAKGADQLCSTADQRLYFH